MAIEVKGREWEAGCYGDGSLGAAGHVRSRLAGLIEDLFGGDALDALVGRLETKPARDDWADVYDAELEALAALNSVTRGGYWDFVDGDLLLLPDEEEVE